MVEYSKIGNLEVVKLLLEKVSSKWVNKYVDNDNALHGDPSNGKMVYSNYFQICYITLLLSRVLEMDILK